MNKEEALAKHDLIVSKQWVEIRNLLFDEIENLSGSDIEPLELKGMLRTIRLADGWEAKYKSLLKNEE